MTREIKFKAKRLDNNEWVYGDLIQLLGEQGKGRKLIVDNRFGAFIDDKGNFINTEAPFVNEVILETICEYTGLKDKNGVEIYENDIGYYKWCDERILMKIIFKDGEFLMSPIEKSKIKTWNIRISGYNKGFKLIGNIYDKEVE